jgi:hypothetical protein
MKILIVTGMEGAQNCAATLAKLLGMECEAVQGRKAAIAALKRSEYAALVVDEGVVDIDSTGAELIWEHAGLAIPLQMNFALSGAQRLAREIRMALNRGERSRDTSPIGRKAPGGGRSCRKPSRAVGAIGSPSGEIIKSQRCRTGSR